MRTNNPLSLMILLFKELPSIRFDSADHPIEEIWRLRKAYAMGSWAVLPHPVVQYILEARTFQRLLLAREMTKRVMGNKDSSAGLRSSTMAFMLS